MFFKRTVAPVTRTQVGVAQQSEYNNLWSISLETYRGTAGKEHLSSEVRSAALWETKELAYSAGGRALRYMEEVGHFPNLSQKW